MLSAYQPLAGPALRLAPAVDVRMDLADLKDLASKQVRRSIMILTPKY